MGLRFDPSKPASPGDRGRECNTRVCHTQSQQTHTGNLLGLFLLTCSHRCKPWGHIFSMEKVFPGDVFISTTHTFHTPPGHLPHGESVFSESPRSIRPQQGGSISCYKKEEFMSLRTKTSKFLNIKELLFIIYLHHFLKIHFY